MLSVERPFNQYRLIYGAAEMARRVGVTRRVMYSMLHNGLIQGAYKKGHHWWITEDDLMKAFNVRKGDEAA